MLLTYLHGTVNGVANGQTREVTNLIWRVISRNDEKRLFLEVKQSHVKVKRSQWLNEIFKLLLLIITNYYCYYYKCSELIRALFRCSQNLVDGFDVRSNVVRH